MKGLSLGYRGPYSHNALMEGVRDVLLDLTPEQLEDADKKRKDNEREYAKMNNAYQHPLTLEREAKALASKKYHWRDCNYYAVNVSVLRIHESSDTHMHARENLILNSNDSLCTMTPNEQPTGLAAPERSWRSRP